MLFKLDLRTLRFQKKIIHSLTSKFSSIPNRSYVYFDNLEIKEGVAIVRLNGIFIFYFHNEMLQVRGR